MEEMHAIIKGSVQGVGFRATAKFYAEKLKLSGFARNLTNGNVEICAQGEKKELESLIAALKEKFGAYIDTIEVKYAPTTSPHHGFKIH